MAAAFPPTAEQQAALDLFATGRSLVVEAGAGTGKTSTLVLLARAAGARHGQYIAFNKAIVTEAGAKMPTNVACSTAHSLAYRAIVSRDRRLALRLKNSRRMKSTELASRLGIREGIWVTVQDGTRKQLSRTYLAGLAMRAVSRFCQSADLEPAAAHVPYVDGIDLPPGARENNRAVARALVPAVRRAWADLSDPNGTLPFKHDHYLKLWHLSGPKIAADFILFDEAQDANPVLVDIVRQQTGAQLVWVGDSQQQIYTFTGAVNALRSVGADQTAFLTRSFRFGPAVADVANRVLALLPDAELRLSGTDSIPSRVEATSSPDVILCRTNARAVRHLLQAIQAGGRPHIVGGGREVVDFAKGARDLMAQGWTSHPELACFESWGEVQSYVEQDEQGGELRLLVSLIDEFGVETILAALERMPSEAEADLIVSTAHKSKGREWNAVQLADDFPAEPSGEELRLLYVAVTRARLVLDVSAIQFLSASGDPVAQEAPVSAEPAASIASGSAAPGPSAPAVVVQGNHRAAAAAVAGVALPTRPATVAEDLAGRPGLFEVIARAGRSGRLQKMGSYEDSRVAIEAASMLYRGGQFSAVCVVDHAGELVVEYDA